MIEPSIEKLPDFALVVVAAGSGTRFGAPKQLAPLAEVPLLVRTLAALDPLEAVLCVVVVPGEWFENGLWDKLRADHPRLDRWQAVAGGAERALSVLAGVSLAQAAGIPIVAVHDGARPFPPIHATMACIRALMGDPTLAGAIISADVTDTIKRVAHEGGEILQTEDRAQLRRAETPQVCRTALLVAALRSPGAATARDDGEVLERAGHRTCCVVHGGWNLKVTHPADLFVAEAILKSESQSP